MVRGIWWQLAFHGQWSLICLLWSKSNAKTADTAAIITTTYGLCFRVVLHNLKSPTVLPLPELLDRIQYENMHVM